MSELQTRLVTAVILAFLALAATWMGGRSFFLFAWMLGGAVLYEWADITAAKWQDNQHIVAAAFYGLLGIGLLIPLPISWLFLEVVIAVFVLGFLDKKHFAWVCGGFLYAALPVICLSALRSIPMFGYGFILLLYAVVWGTDIGAYFVGRAFGGAKLAPRLSPNKTWAGALGGLAFAVIASFLALYLFTRSAPWIWDFMLGSIRMNSGILASFVGVVIFLSIVSQIGDIAQSLLKRRFGVKHSGDLLPGHGGMMDRLDGFIFATIVFYIMLFIFVFYAQSRFSLSLL
ncbi:phosphatidate cytidylyltransferase [Bartonella sp. DGB2]|uniref:phosphatidate cytidylyltransferase n=1 Tax=Bartonella sp. DGB2 TaxID=3388426 RepID=UPI00398FA701